MSTPLLIIHKNTHYLQFADAVYHQYKEMRYGIQSCHKTKDLLMASLCKEIIDWYDLSAPNYGSAIAAPCSNPTITSQPQNHVPEIGSAHTLSVTASSATPILYQWYKNGVAILNATLSIYDIPVVQESDFGSYSVVLTNECGTTFSSVVTIGPSSCPPPVITSQPSSSTLLVGAQLSLSITATDAVSYQWRKNGSNISGATSATYTIPSVVTNSAGTYTCAVTNTCGTVISSSAVVTITQCVLPTITVQPSGQTVLVGANVTLSVTATTPSGTLSYQWKKAGVVINGATSSSYTITNAQQAASGSYTVDVTNSGCGTVGSNAATLTVNAPVTYDTVMVFTSTNTPTTLVGVTAAAPATNANLKFEFNAGAPTGLPATMDIYVGSTDPANFRMTVNYRPNTYTGAQFRFTDTNGTQYTSTFSAGNKIL